MNQGVRVVQTAVLGAAAVLLAFGCTQPSYNQLPIPTELAGYQVTFTTVAGRGCDVFVFQSAGTFLVNGVEAPADWSYAVTVGERSAIVNWTWRESDWPVPAGEVTTVKLMFDHFDCCRGSYVSTYQQQTLPQVKGTFVMVPPSH